jgi:hypothetical protein
MDPAQSVHDALEVHASQGPAAQRDVEPPAPNVEFLRAADPEGHAWPRCRREPVPSLGDALRIRIERQHRVCVHGRELRESSHTAADVEHALTSQVDDFGNRRRLRTLAIAFPHGG